MVKSKVTGRTEPLVQSGAPPLNLPSRLESPFSCESRELGCAPPPLLPLEYRVDPIGIPPPVSLLK